MKRPKLTFEQWMKEVDLYLEERHHVSSSDLADWRYHDDWSDGLSPMMSARRAITYDRGGNP